MDDICINNYKLIADVTGVGEAVVKLFKDQSISIDIRVTISNGNSAVREEHTNKWNVPKKDLVSSLQISFQTNLLKIAKDIDDVDIITNELINFKIDKVKLKNDPLSIEESWREKINDDYVFAAAVAVWQAIKPVHTVGCLIVGERSELNW